MHTPDLLGCADKYILIDISKLIGFGYDWSDIKDGPRFWINGVYGFIFCG